MSLIVNRVRLRLIEMFREIHVDRLKLNMKSVDVQIKSKSKCNISKCSKFTTQIACYRNF